ncbi:MAG: hypothetical protein QXE01_02325 [Sulfolobales archaeon]
MGLERSRMLMHISSLTMILVIMGAAIAMWSDSLKIKTTINTGDVDVEFGEISTNDPEGSVDPGYTKNVGTCYANKVEIENEDQGNPSGNNDLDLNITIVNAYPSYNCTITFEVRNTGTIPVKGPHVTTDSDFNSWNGTYVICIANFTEIQIDPGQSAWFKISCHVLQSAQENQIYKGQIYLMFHQWNEEPTTTTPPPPLQPQIRKFFTNSTGGQLPYDGQSFYVNISSKGPPGNKRFDGTNPQHVVHIIDFQNGGSAISSLNITDYLPVDWIASPSGNSIAMCKYTSLPSGFPYGSGWPSLSCTGGTQLATVVSYGGGNYMNTYTFGGGTIMVNITRTGSFPGINQVIRINITGITIGPGEHIVIVIKTEFAGEDNPYDLGYFNSGTGPLGNYKLFTNTAKAEWDSNSISVSASYRGYPK